MKPDLAEAHYNLGVVLGHKGNLDGASSEYREAIRLKPDYAEAHYNLGVVLGHKGDRQGALEQYRRASELDPKEDAFRGNYERLSKELKK